MFYLECILENDWQAYNSVQKWVLIFSASQSVAIRQVTQPFKKT